MEITLNQHIEITPGIRGGKPRIAGTRMTVADIATLYLRSNSHFEEEYNLSSLVYMENLLDFCF